MDAAVSGVQVDSQGGIFSVSGVLSCQTYDTEAYGEVVWS